MKKYFLILLSISVYSCSNKNEEQIELVIQKENIKHVIDSLVSLNANTGLIHELCVDYYAIGYRLTLVAVKDSYQQEIGKSFTYLLSNGIRVNVYTGVENLLQPVRANHNINEEINQNKINENAVPSFWVIDIDYYDNYKITKVVQDIPFAGYQENSIIY